MVIRICPAPLHNLSLPLFPALCIIMVNYKQIFIMFSIFPNLMFFGIIICIMHLKGINTIYLYEVLPIKAFPHIPRFQYNLHIFYTNL